MNSRLYLHVGLGSMRISNWIPNQTQLMFSSFEQTSFRMTSCVHDTKFEDNHVGSLGWSVGLHSICGLLILSSLPEVQRRISVTNPTGPLLSLMIKQFLWTWLRNFVFRFSSFSYHGRGPGPCGRGRGHGGGVANAASGKHRRDNRNGSLETSPFANKGKVKLQI